MRPYSANRHADSRITMGDDNLQKRPEKNLGRVLRRQKPGPRKVSKQWLCIMSPHLPGSWKTKPPSGSLLRQLQDLVEFVDGLLHVDFSAILALRLAKSLGKRLQRHDDRVIEIGLGFQDGE